MMILRGPEFTPMTLAPAPMAAGVVKVASGLGCAGIEIYQKALA